MRQWNLIIFSYFILMLKQFQLGKKKKTVQAAKVKPMNNNNKSSQFLEALQRDFLWDGICEPVFHLVNWKIICSLAPRGGWVCKTHVV